MYPRVFGINDLLRVEDVVGGKKLLKRKSQDAENVDAVVLNYC
jgi:hypothetical protein